MTEDDLKKRTKQFALRVMTLAHALPKSPVGGIIARQMIRSGTSVGANYRAACRARSKAEFIAKLGTVAEEADESAYWLELVMEGKLLNPNLVQALYDEANQLTAIVTSSIKSSKKDVD